MTLIHIVSAFLALAAGAIALAVTKGSALHRRSGQVFTAAMLTMTSSAFVVATFLRPNRINIVAASLTFYLVATAFLAVRPLARSRRWVLVLMLGAMTTGIFAYAVGAEKLARGDAGFSAFFFVFGSVAWLGAIGDYRVIRIMPLEGAPRLIRHLWRMSTAMLIATMSFFLGQADLLPEWLREQPGLRVLPILLVFLAMVMWLSRLRFNRQRSLPAAVQSARPDSR